MPNRGTSRNREMQRATCLVLPAAVCRREFGASDCDVIVILYGSAQRAVEVCVSKPPIESVSKDRERRRAQCHHHLCVAGRQRAQGRLGGVGFRVGTAQKKRRGPAGGICLWSHLRGHVLFGGHNPRANKAARKNREKIAQVLAVWRVASSGTSCSPRARRHRV
jgi:hypothetical protein